MTAVGVIPARFASTRFPGKVLSPVDGIPMVQRVFEGARRAKTLRDVIVATEDMRVVEACKAFGAKAVMTAPDHPTGTDRLAEVAIGIQDEIIVNIQGDEPLMDGFVIDAAVEALIEDPGVVMATVVHAMDLEAIDDPNRVKVVMDRRGRALYFSRAVIPARQQGAERPRYWQHVGLYAYRRPFLLDFVTLEPTPAEGAEHLEQLRVLEHGHAIRCAIVENWHSAPVDVPADIPRVEALLRGEHGDPDSTPA